jgi:hypothetical protein
MTNMLTKTTASTERDTKAEPVTLHKVVRLVKFVGSYLMIHVSSSSPSTLATFVTLLASPPPRSRAEISGDVSGARRLAFSWTVPSSRSPGFFALPGFFDILCDFSYEL